MSIIKYKACDTAEQLSDGSVKVLFINQMNGIPWTHTFPPECGLTVDAILSWANGEARIQSAMPQLTATEREFFLTGFTESEQKEIFGE